MTRCSKVSRRTYCTFVVLAVLLGSTSTAFGDTRNVLLIIADDQGRDLGVYGNPVLRTPNLDRLAARGTLFTNAFATVSSCSPSRSVIYTGLYSHSNGMYGLAHDVHNQHLLPSVRTLPQFLKAAGYRTGLVGKKHILPESALPFDEELAPELPGNRDVAFMADEARKFISKQRRQAVSADRRLQRSASRAAELRQYAHVAASRASDLRSRRR